MTSSHRRGLAALFISFTAVLTLTPIEAGRAHPFGPTYARNRGSLENWAPTIGSLDIKPVASNPVLIDSTFKFAMRWEDPLKMFEAHGRHRAIEQVAEIKEWSGIPLFKPRPDCTRATNNYPSAAKEYCDTTLGDDGDGTIGFGAGIADGLTHTITYEATIPVESGIAPSPAEVEVRVEAATSKDHVLGSGIDFGCGFGYQYCTFDDYSWISVRSREMDFNPGSPSAIVWRQNLLGSNAGFESGLSGWAGFPTNANVNALCVPTGGYFSNCYAEVKGSSTASVYQDVFSSDIKQGDHYTGEAMIQCPFIAGGTGCSVEIAYWGLDSGSPPDPEVRGSGSVILGNGSGWQLCRVDYDHGAAQGFLTGHQRLRLEIYNTSGGNRPILVDFAALGKVKQTTVGTSYDLNPPSPSPPVICTTNIGNRL